MNDATTDRLLEALSIKFGESKQEIIERLVWDEFIAPPKVYNVVNRETNELLFYGRYVPANDFCQRLTLEEKATILFFRSGNPYYEQLLLNHPRN